MIKKLLWVFKRHPFLYIARFKLLSKNSSIEDIDKICYNDLNPKNHIPDYFKEVNNIIFSAHKPESDLELVKTLNIWLNNNIKGGPGLSEPSENALKIMLEGKGGVCSDMAQIFNNFGVINDIKVREWGNTRAPFDESYGGHSFNEVFIKDLNKWILVDTSSSVMFYHNDMPLSVLELYQLINENKEIKFKSFNTLKVLDENNIKRNYLNPDTIPFLVCNYSNKTYDAFLKYTRPYIPIFVTHFILFIFGKSYYYRFPLGDYKKIFLKKSQ
ncbi:transglutaminase domain-containing protein [Psychroserpens sp. S379A]|uniref:transglutaminase domain-containing protein n=1 Tax=Psychroserpens sp. S379A TaxID=3415137 RepID=UPI003C7E2956